MKIEISAIDNVYANEIIEMILHIQQQEFKIKIGLEDQPDLMDIRDFYYQSGGGFWGAFADDELVGTIALIKFSEQHGAIRKMFVRKDFRGKEHGIAQRLLDTLIADSKQKGLNNLYLGTVPVLVAALRFYEKNGFIRIPADSLPEAFPKMKPDTVFCNLPLD